MLEEVFNVEFKLYLKNKGVNVDYAMLLEYTKTLRYRQAELDNRISTNAQYRQFYTTDLHPKI